MLVPGKVFQPSLMLASKLIAYSRVEHLSMTNTLAYYKNV